MVKPDVDGSVFGFDQIIAAQSTVSGKLIWAVDQSQFKSIFIL
jgi:hypothetical protein